MTAVEARHAGNPEKAREPVVLVVDDDDSFRTSIAEALSLDGYSVIPAPDGLDALAVLGARHVDLVLTDLKMPRMDGLSLVENLFNRKDSVPCLVMTAFSTPELERRLARLGALRAIGKPVDLGALRELIRRTLREHQEGGSFRGVTLASFLQLLALERMTCTVKAFAGGKSGLLFLRGGELVDATTGLRDGLDACYELLSWPVPEIVVHSGCPRTGSAIAESLEGILLEAMKRMDERVDPAKPDEREEDIMALENHLDEFKGIKGYLASGILNYTGEVLAVHTVSEKVNLDAVAAVFNDVFRGAHEASSKIGLEATRVMTLQTPRGLVLMACSGTDAASHIHMISILEESGNQALARMTLDKTLPKVVAELS